MPALLPISDVLRVAFRGTAANVNIVNILHISKTPSGTVPYTQAQVDAIATSLATMWQTRMLPSLSQAYVPREVVCTDLGSISGVVGVKAMTGTGTSGASSCPNSVATCITWKVARHYRGGHPRTYMGPIATSDVLNGTTFVAAHVTRLTTAANGLLADIAALATAGAPYFMVVPHRVRGGVLIDPVELSRPSGAVVDDRIDTQRRRLGPDR